MDTKRCTKCTEVKLIQDFSTRAKGELRVAISVCRECSNLQAKEMYRNKREDRLLKSNERYSPERAREYYLKNREYIINQTGIRFKEYMKDPLFRFKFNTRAAVSTAFSRTFKRSYSKKDSSTVSILGCSLDFFTQYIQEKFTEGMTLENHGEWHLDHVIPLATAATREDVVRLNHYTNFQPLWAKDNLSKGAKII